MTIEDLARSLGRALAETPELRDLTAREKAYAGDRDAQKKVKDAQEAGTRLAQVQAEGGKLPDAEVRKIAEIQANLDGCEVVQRLVAAQKAYDALVQRVNAMVQAAVQEHRAKA